MQPYDNLLEKNQALYGDWVGPEEDDSCKIAYEKYGDLSAYQNEDLECALRFVKNFRTAIDIGAHIGIISYHLNKKFKTVHSFEIDQEMFQCLQKNQEKKFSNVNIYNFGIGAEEKNVDLVYTDKRSFSTYVNPLNTGGNNFIKPLDMFNFENVDFLKIDVEGYEMLVAQGAIETIKKSKPVILYERKDHAKRFGYERDTILDFLKPLGYFQLDRKKNNFKFKKSNGIMVCDEEYRSLGSNV